eukprot:8019129-Karenia_brevis.AAC.1
MSVPSTVAASTPSGTPSGSPSEESHSSGGPVAPESQNTFNMLTENLEPMVSTLGNQLFQLGGYAVIKRTGSPNAHQLVKLKAWITMLLTIFPEGHPDLGVIRGA